MDLIEKARLSAATSDMRVSRREGSLYICQTLNGLLELSYEAGSYKLISCGSVSQEAAVLAEGASRFVKPVLAKQYRVEIEA